MITGKVTNQHEYRESTKVIFMVTNYNIRDMEQLISSIKQDNERTCDCFENLANLSEKIKGLLEIALNIDDADRSMDSFRKLIDSIDDYAWEMKQLSNAYVLACDVKSHIC